MRPAAPAGTTARRSTSRRVRQ